MPAVKMGETQMFGQIYRTSCQEQEKEHPWLDTQCDVPVHPYMIFCPFSKDYFEFKGFFFITLQIELYLF